MTTNLFFSTLTVPMVTVQISDSGVTPTAGESYALTCSVSGAENLNSSTTYQWTKNNGTQTQVGTKSSTLNFLSLRLSDTGQYSCLATVTVSSHHVINTTSRPYEINIPGQYLSCLIILYMYMHVRVHTCSPP